MSAPEHGAELFQLDRATCIALLTRQHVGRLVVGADIVPVNYVASDATITFRTRPEGSIDRAEGRDVVFEVDMFDDRTRSGWSVIVRGHLQRLADGAGTGPETWAPGDRSRGMTVTVGEVTGRLLRGAVDADPDAGPGGYL